MADFTANTSISNKGGFGQAFLMFWEWLAALGENSARAQLLREFSEMTDEELASHGLTRAEIVRRVFADKYYI